MGKAQIQLRNLSNAYEHLALAREISDFSEFPFLNIETNSKLVETSLPFSRLEDKNKWLNEANDLLILAETLVIEIKHAQLLLELQFLRSLLVNERGDNKKAIHSLRKLLDSNIIKNYSEMEHRIHNVIMALEESSEPISEIDILMYLDKIAQLVEITKHGL